MNEPNALLLMRTRAVVAEELRRLLPRMEGFRTTVQSFSLGVSALDSHLPQGGLASGALHEVVPADGGTAAAFGFIAALLTTILPRKAGEDEKTHPIFLVLPAFGLRECGRLSGHGLSSLGLDPARLARQIHEIDRLNEKLHRFTILKGIEVDILKDGRLDLPDSSLAKLDLVVAAVHSHFDLLRDAQTDRIVRAMENKHVSIIAHPTGRLIGEREPYDVDMDRIVLAARDTGCYLEINAEPDRLDLNDTHAHAARSKGVKVAVSTDAHSVNAFKYLRFGIDQARRGWLTADDVINTRSLAELRKLLKR